MTSYTNVFGGTVIYPAEVSYRAVALDDDLTLSWPTEVSTDQNVVSQIMDVTPDMAGWTITMPPADQVSVGETTLIFNVGSFAFTVADNDGNTIASISPGLAWQLYVTDNTTAAGTWRPLQYAAGASSATAGALAGAGIKAISSTLNQSAPIVDLATNYTIGNSDRAKAFLWTGGAGTFTLPSAATVGNDWFCYVRNGGTGAVTLIGPGGETVNGDVSLIFNPGDSATVICDGSDFFTIGFGQAPQFTFDYVAINLTGQSSPYTLSGANLNRITYNFGGVLTGNMIVVVPDTIQQYWVANNTTGAYTLTIANVSGTGVVVPQNSRTILYCDGVDIYTAETGGISTPILVSQGGTGATNAATALVNLGGTAVGTAVFTAASENAGRAALGSTTIGNDLFTAANAAAARTTISAAQSGANSDITSITGLTTPLAVNQGGTGVATITGLVKGAGTSAFAAATAGTDYVAPGTATTFTATQTFTGSTSVAAEIVRNIVEPITVSATAATGTIAIYPSTQSVLYYTTNASANFTVNLAWSSGTTMNTALSTGQAVTVAFMVTNGSTAYYNSSVQVDGTTSGVTTRWQGGLAPTAGNINSVDVYTYTVIKTGSATFTVLASVAQFA